jgi:hypothetical protein
VGTTNVNRPRMKWCADLEAKRGAENLKSRLPAHAGTAAFGDNPTRRPALNGERSAGTRGRAEHGVAPAPLRLLGQRCACHRRSIVRVRPSAVKRFSTRSRLSGPSSRGA